MDLAQSNNLGENGLINVIPLKKSQVLIKKVSECEVPDRFKSVNTDFIVVVRNNTINDDYKTSSMETIFRRNELLKNKKIDTIDTSEERSNNNPLNETINIKTNLYNYSKPFEHQHSGSIQSLSKFFKKNINSSLPINNKPFSKQVQNDLKTPSSFKTIEKLTIKSEKKTFNRNEEKPICKICYEGEENKKKLIIPCKCQGSMKYIHEICLKKWIEKQDDMSTPECEICKYKYNIRKIYIYKFSKKKCWDTIKGTSIVMVIVTIVMTLLLSITYIIIGTSLNFTEDEKSFTARILLLIVGLINFFICLYICRNVKKNFYYKNLSDYTIENISSTNNSKYSDLSKSSNKLGKQEMSSVFVEN